MGMGTGEEEGAGGGEGVDRRGQEENQTMRIIGRLRKLKEGAEEIQQAYNTMEQYFEGVGKKHQTMKFKGALQMRFQTLREGWRNYMVS